MKKISPPIRIDQPASERGNPPQHWNYNYTMQPCGFMRPLGSLCLQGKSFIEQAPNTPPACLLLLEPYLPFLSRLSANKRRAGLGVHKCHPENCSLHLLPHAQGQVRLPVPGHLDRPLPCKVFSQPSSCYILLITTLLT